VDCLVRSLPPNLANAVASKFQGSLTTIDEVHKVVLWELQSPACAACGTKHDGSTCPTAQQPHTYRHGFAHAPHRRPATAVVAAVDSRQHGGDGSSPDSGTTSTATEPGYLVSPGGAQAGFGYAYPVAAAPAHGQAPQPPSQQQQPFQPQPTMVAQPPQFYPAMAAGTQPQAFQPSPPDGPPPGMCFSCKQSGHYARDCPAAQCYKCGQVGHISRSCPGGQPVTQTGQGEFRRQGGRGCRRQGCNNEVHALGDCPNFGGCPYCGSRSHLGHSCPQNSQNRQNRSPGNGRR
jgi:cellular nucleic acid-binding protein